MECKELRFLDEWTTNLTLRPLTVKTVEAPKLNLLKQPIACTVPAHFLLVMLFHLVK